MVVNSQHQLGLLLLSTSLLPDCQRDFAWLSFADLIASQHLLDLSLLTSLSTASVLWTYLHGQPHRRPMASMTLLGFLLPTLSPASIRWNFFVVDILIDRLPA